MAADGRSTSDHTENTFRIMISTDNHLGYLERDEVRGSDSFDAFEEVMLRSNQLKADILLLGGDLFHDNKPSRECVVRTMKLMRKHCFGDRPCTVEPLDVTCMGEPDDKEGPTVNYQDPNINIGLPVFIIHGNHDDQAGQKQYSALDILSSAGMVNYFGKQKKVDVIRIKPLLMKKGNVHIALYGLGNIRDERLAQTFRDQKVTWEQPEGDDQYFNILVIHQNRPAREVKSCFPVDGIPKWINFVVWGHEHECITKASKTGANNVFVLQPGSTTMTSLTHGESAVKHVFCLDVKKLDGDVSTKWKCKEIALSRVRTFVYEEISLQGGQCAATEDAVKDYLTKVVEGLIVQADEKRNCPEEFKKPLIRLKVEHTGYPQLHPKRFGAEFGSGQHIDKYKVANPNELLLFWRKGKVRQSNVQQVVHDRGNGMDDDEDDEDDLLEAPDMEKLVMEELAMDRDRGKQLQILENKELITAIKEFVDQEENKAIQTMVDRRLKEVDTVFQKDAGASMGDLSCFEGDPKKDEEKIAKMMLATLSASASQKLIEKERARADGGEGKTADGGRKSKATTIDAMVAALGMTNRPKGGAAAKDDDDDDDDDSDSAPAAAKKGTRKAPAARAKPVAGAKAGKAGKAGKSDASQGKLSFAASQRSDGGGGGDDVPPLRPAGRKRAAPTSYKEVEEEDFFDEEADAEERDKRKRARRAADSDDD